MSDQSYINSQCVAFNISRLSRTIIKLFNYELKKLNDSSLTIGHLNLLAELTRKEEGTRPLMDISAALGMDRTTLLRNANVLIKVGYVKKRQTSRNHYLSITDKGRSMLEDTIPMWQSINSKFLEESKKIMGYQYRNDATFMSQMIEDINGMNDIGISLERKQRVFIVPEVRKRRRSESLV